MQNDTCNSIIRSKGYSLLALIGTKLIGTLAGFGTIFSWQHPGDYRAIFLYADCIHVLSIETQGVGS